MQKFAFSLPSEAWCEVPWREGIRGPVSSRFAAARVHSAHGRKTETSAIREIPEEEWLLIEWPSEEPEPTHCWMSTMPATMPMDALVDLAMLRWRIEQDYDNLKQEAGLDHFEGRNWGGFHHHGSLCIAAYAFLIAEQARPSSLAKILQSAPRAIIRDPFPPFESGSSEA